MELDEFFKGLSDNEKIQMMRRFQTQPLHLPLVLASDGSDKPWFQLNVEQYTKKLLVRYTKETINTTDVFKRRN